MIALPHAPRRFLAIVASACIFLSCASAWAGVLYNHDRTSYALTFKRGSGSVETRLQARRALAFHCSALPCRITITATGQSIELTSNDEDVVIEHGRLKLARPNDTAPRKR